jgi:hypothetical protein
VTIDQAAVPCRGQPTSCRAIVRRDGEVAEIEGQLAQPADPTVSAIFRQVPLRRVVTGTGARPLTVRTLTSVTVI